MKDWELLDMFATVTQMADGDISDPEGGKRPRIADAYVVKRFLVTSRSGPGFNT